MRLFKYINKNMSISDSATTISERIPSSIESTLELDLGGCKPKKYFGFTGRQLLFILTYGLYNSSRGIFLLMTPPFYPVEAEARGITATSIGFVFGSYDFATFFFSLLYGKFFLPRFGPRNIIIFSAVNTTVCAILFGCHGWIRDKTTFLTFSFLLRLIGGAFDAGLYPAAFAVFAVEFPALMSTAVGLFQFFFGLGAIIGPIACGPLIDLIGFEWSYIAVGGLILLCSLLILTISPVPNQEKGGTSLKADDDGDYENRYGLNKLVSLPEIWFAILSLFSTAISIGFLGGVLGKHLHQLQLSSLQVGLFFSLSTGLYTISSPVWGQVSDRLGLNKIIIIGSGSFLTIIGFILLAPLDFISEDYLLWGTAVGLCLHGIGMGSAMIVFFPYASETAIKHKFPDTTATYGLVSSIFTLTFSLGVAIGPALSGTLYDAVGFKDSTLAIIGLSSLVIICAGMLFIYNGRRSQRL